MGIISVNTIFQHHPYKITSSNLNTNFEQKHCKFFFHISPILPKGFMLYIFFYQLSIKSGDIRQVQKLYLKLIVIKAMMMK